MADDKIRLKASDIKAFLEGESVGTFDDFISQLETAVETLESEHNDNFILGPVIIENDLEVEDEEDEDEESESDETETTNEEKK